MATGEVALCDAVPVMVVMAVIVAATIEPDRVAILLDPLAVIGQQHFALGDAETLALDDQLVGIIRRRLTQIVGALPVGRDRRAEPVDMIRIVRDDAEDMRAIEEVAEEADGILDAFQPFAAQIAGVAFDKVAIFLEQTVERMIAQDLDQRVDRRVGGLCAQMAVAQDDGGHGRSPWD